VLNARSVIINTENLKTLQCSGTLFSHLEKAGTRLKGLNFPVWPLQGKRPEKHLQKFILCVQTRRKFAEFLKHIAYSVFVAPKMPLFHNAFFFLFK